MTTTIISQSHQLQYYISMSMVVATCLALLFLITLQALDHRISLVSSISDDRGFRALEQWREHKVRKYRSSSQIRHLASAAGDGVGLDHRLVAAEERVRVVRVEKDGTGDFRTVREAVESIPAGNRRRVVIWIGRGEYQEKITLPASKPFVTFYGDHKSMPAITYDATANQYGTIYSATVAIESDNFVAVNVVFVNSAPMPDGKRVGAQALALRISGDQAAFHNCKFIGYQDTLCDDRGRHLFEHCYIQGSTDFIFGNAKSLYLRTSIHSVAEGLGIITAQARENFTDDTGFTFMHCNIRGSGNTFLGRAWKPSPRVVFAYTYMDPLINCKGWFDTNPSDADQHTHKNAYYGEYRCTGPGASFSRRVKYAKLLSDKEAEPFLTMTSIHARTWLLPPPKL